MSDITAVVVPARPASQWPVGARLRFLPEAELNPSHERLRGTMALVLGEMQLIGPSNGRYSWRQQILSLSTCRVGWARPDQLGLPLDGEDAEAG
ncbi:hypothetical protein [Solimonas sp. SE-A11]|uniref:hypothetical protein n=1 Tax=Solimonas sp. SE-A11 TaxID=3054954 RepID=UPI00259C8459|nr:hypothetical protein [Solimonas sp. SE-A11]MDM4768939.1 hypothetical protein [Solimonas sp. SE-A11]